MTVSETEVTDEMLTAAMRAFELMSSVLRYREKDKWHSCDVMGMRDAIRAALAARPAALSDQVVVPKEATDAQIISALEWSLEWMRAHNVDGLSPFKDYPPVKDTIKGMYACMIAAAPASTSGEVGK